MGGDGNGCGIGLLGVTSNKLVTFPRRPITWNQSSCQQGMYKALNNCIAILTI